MPVVSKLRANIPLFLLLAFLVALAATSSALTSWLLMDTGATPGSNALTLPSQAWIAATALFSLLASIFAILFLHQRRELALSISRQVQKEAQFQVEQALIESEKRFLDVARTSLDWLWEMDADFRYTFSSDSVSQCLGYAPAEILGRTPFELIPPEESERAEDALRSLLKHGVPFRDLENTMLHKDGSLRHLLSNGIPMFDGEGQLRGYRGSDKDITERRKFEDQLRVLSLVAEHSPNALIITNAERQIEYVNPSFTRITGYPAAEALGKQAGFNASGQTPASDFASLNANLTQGLAWRGEFINRKRDGSIHINRSYVVPIGQEGGQGKGKVSHYLSVQEDVTEQRWMEKELDRYHLDLEELIADRTKQLEAANLIAEQSSKLLEEAVSSIPHGFTIYDQEDRLVMCNEAHLNFYSNCRDVLTPGTNVEDTLRHAAQQGLVRDAVGRCDEWIEERLELFHQASGKHFEQQLADGRWLMAVETKTPSGYLVGNRTDITELKKAQQLLTEARDAANAGSYAKSLFLANMSHEIRTPMNAIIGLSHLCLQTPLSAKQRDYITKTHRAATLLLGILNDVLDFSKIEAGKLNIETIVFSLDEDIASTISLLSTTAQEKGLDFQFTIAPEIPSELMGDPLRLRQILSNLISNAIKFTPQGSVSIRVEPAAPIKAGEACEISFIIADTGIGMSPSQIDKLFHTFSQADSSTTRKFGGTGLGLSICKQLVEMMGGHIDVQSQPGMGSVFRFTLPFQPSATPAKQPDGIDKHQVLIVEDDKIQRTVLQRILEDFGFTTCAVDCGEAALSAIEEAASNNLAFDLILMDLRLPGMDGFATTQALRKREAYRKVPVVMISGANFDEMRSMQHTGIDYYLFKPIRRSVLFDTVQGIFARQNEPLSANAPSGSPPSIPIPGMSGRRILLVEDNEFNQQVGKELLEAKGILVDIAEDGLQAIEALEKTAYDLVLMDLQMPVMDGIAATMAIRADPRFAKLPIIAMTANALVEERARCIEAGMNDFIAKPISPDLLYKSIITSLSGQAASNRVPPPLDSVFESTSLPPASNKVLDTEAGLFYANGRQDVYIKLARHFQDKHRDAIPRLRAACLNNDNEGARRIAHMLKGTAGTLGAGPLAEAARELEAAFKGGEMVTTDSPLIAQLEGQLTLLFPHLEALTENGETVLTT